MLLLVEELHMKMVLPNLLQLQLQHSLMVVCYLLAMLEESPIAANYVVAAAMLSFYYSHTFILINIIHQKQQQKKTRNATRTTKQVTKEQRALATNKSNSMTLHVFVVLYQHVVIIEFRW
jgi:hypothetical protein